MVTSMVWPAVVPVAARKAGFAITGTVGVHGVDRGEMNTNRAEGVPPPKTGSPCPSAVGTTIPSTVAHRRA